MNRGEIILVEFPFSDGSGIKRRPALVVQADSLNKSSRETIAATITTRTTPSPTTVFIDPVANPDSGLRLACAVNCSNLHTLSESLVYGAIGKLSKQTMREVDDYLKIALGIK